jgi:hypothetical protein
MANMAKIPTSAKDVLTPTDDRDRTCHVHISNQCPADWGVTLIQAGVKYFYQDQNGNIIKDETQQRNINVTTGHSTDFFSQDPSGCVQQAFIAIIAAWVENGQTQTKTLTDQPTTDAGHCLTFIPEVVGKQRLLAHGAIMKIADRITL